MDGAGNMINWDMVHHDVQIIGGLYCTKERLLRWPPVKEDPVATFPSFLNALSKRGVHIVTVNNYLALPATVSGWLPCFSFTASGRLYRQTGPNTKPVAMPIRLTLRTVPTMNLASTTCAITWRETDELVQRGHHYAMVDEVDSVLIDEGPYAPDYLRPDPRGDAHEFYDLKPGSLKWWKPRKNWQPIPE